MDIIVLRTFLGIIDEGSFASAARRLGISRSLASKHVSDLEAELGTRLLSRTTRSVQPTAVGREYSRQVRDILQQLDSANETVREASGRAVGKLKIGAPTLYALKILQPHLLRFIEQYPEILMEIVLDDGASDLIGGGFDAVIRIGFLADSTLHARRLHQAAILLVSSPSYVADRGTPQKPADLLLHSCLHYTNLRGPDTWPLQQGEEIVYQKIQPSLSSNNPDLLRSMAVSGRGIALMPQFAVTDDLATGRLVAIMQEYALPAIPVHLVYPSGKLMTSAMRRLLDFFQTIDFA